jgi:hypothetical protein
VITVILFCHCAHEMNFLLCNLIPLESSRKRRIVYSEYLDSLPGFREIVRFEHSDTSLVLSTP